MGNSLSKKQKKEKRAATSPVVNDEQPPPSPPSVVAPLPPSESRVISNREIQDAISRGSVFLFIYLLTILFEDLGP